MSGSDRQTRRISPAWLLGAAGAGLLAREAWRRLREVNLRGQVALVTGSSRGLGFLLAREFAREGCRLVLCARDAQELERARSALVAHGADVLTVPCDVGNRGQVSVPHLIPYSCAKFAAVAFSEGLRAELAGEGIPVVTVVPGLMRTGGYLNARFKGRQEAEFTWFSLSASLPGLSMSAERAARRIVQATRRGEAEVILSLPASLLAGFHGLFPGATADLLGLANRFILPDTDHRTEAARGTEVQARIAPPVLDTLTGMGRAAARRYQVLDGENGREVP